MHSVGTRPCAISLGVFHFFLMLLPCGKLFLRFVLGDTIRFLNFADKFVAFACNHIDLVIGELAPLLLDAAFDLFPITFNTIPVNVGFLYG